MTDTATEHHRRIVELERADAARSALERAAVRLENYNTNELYKRVLKLGARLVRALKDVDNGQQLT